MIIVYFVQIDYKMAGKNTKNIFWMVFVGHQPGIYNNWEEAEVQVNGYLGSLMKRYNTLDEAEIALLNFHSAHFRVKDVKFAQRNRKSNDGASTSASDEKISFSFIVIFFLGFLACILLSLIFDLEWTCTYVNYVKRFALLSWPKLLCKCNIFLCFTIMKMVPLLKTKVDK